MLLRLCTAVAPRRQWLFVSASTKKHVLPFLSLHPPPRAPLLVPPTTPLSDTPPPPPRPIPSSPSGGARLLLFVKRFPGTPLG